MTKENTNLAGQDSEIVDAELNQVAGGRVQAVEQAAEDLGISHGPTKAGVVMLGAVVVVSKRKDGGIV